MVEGGDVAFAFTPMKAGPSLLTRRSVQSCLLKGMIFPKMSSLCFKRRLSRLLVMWFDQEGAMMI